MNYSSISSGQQLKCNFLTPWRKAACLSNRTQQHPIRVLSLMNLRKASMSFPPIKVVCELKPLSYVIDHFICQCGGVKYCGPRSFYWQRRAKAQTTFDHHLHLAFIIVISENYYHAHQKWSHVCDIFVAIY